MQFEINNRFNGAVQFTAEIYCDSGASSAVRIGLAVKWAVKTGVYLGGADLNGAKLHGADLSGADLSGAYLRSADLSGARLNGAYLHGADLSGADLSCAKLHGACLSGAYLLGTDLGGADLSGAKLHGACLSGAYLHGADLSGADLSGADLSGADLIHCGSRSDGYEFFAHVRNGNLWIMAGCRYFTVADAKVHWANTRAGTQLGDESLQLVANAERLAIIRGLIKAETTE